MTLTLLVRSGPGLNSTIRSHERFGDDSELLVYGGQGDNAYPALSEAMSLARGSHVALLAAGDALEPGGIKAITQYLAETGDDAVYTNHIYAGKVVYKPAWSHRLLQQVPYPGRLTAIRKEIAIPHAGQSPFSEWAFLLGALGAAGTVGHIGVTGAALSGPLDRGGAEHAIMNSLRHTEPSSQLQRLADGSYRVRAGVAPDHLVSIIVPTATGRREIRGNQVLLVRNLLLGLSATRHESWEVILVASENADLAELENCRTIDPDRIQITRVPGPFNFSTSVNHGVLASRGDSILLLNDDTEITDPMWLGELLGVAQRPGVGAVGATLLFGDGSIQHIGVVVPPDALPMHPRIFERLDGREDESLDLDYLAVTGACLLVSREDFFAVGGLTEHLPLNFNDVDFCLKLAALGRTNVNVGAVRLTHFESSSREARIEDFEIAALDSWRALRVSDPHPEYWA